MYTVTHRGLSAVVSNYPANAAIPADPTHCLAHERVIATVMARFTILPCEFGTVAPSEQAVLKLLSRERPRIQSALRRVHGKVEVVVKAYWRSLQTAAQAVVKEHPAIAHYRAQIAAQPSERSYKDRMHIGEMIAAALNEKRRKEAASLLRAFQRVAVATNQKAALGDTMVLNAAFLVRKADVPKFERALQTLGKQHEGHLDFKYLGPLPPYSFTSMVLRG